jgi:RHS repeat-associated protein
MFHCISKNMRVTHPTYKFFCFYIDYKCSLIFVQKKGSTTLEQMSYDPWGRRRNGENWHDYYNTTTPFTSLYKRGYTGHEHIDVFGLINMNGRMYDPRLGRFLSPDPFVQAPSYTQSYNRYSYGWNNPMKYTDPTGYKNIATREYSGYGGEDGNYSNFIRLFGYGSSGIGSIIGGPSSLPGANWVNAPAPTYKETQSQTQSQSNQKLWASFRIYEIEGFGFVGAFGPLGQMTVWSNGAITFANKTAGTFFYWPAVVASGDEGGGGESWLSNLWNNSFFGKLIPDVIYLNTGSTLTYLGGGGYTTGYALQLKGKEGVKLYSTLTLNFKTGFHFSLWGLNIGYSSYVGDSRNFSFKNSFCGESTRGFDMDIVAGIGGVVSPMDMYGGRLYSYDAGIGWSLGASLNIGSITFAQPVKWP